MLDRILCVLVDESKWNYDRQHFNQIDALIKMTVYILNWWNHQNTSNQKIWFSYI